MVPSAYVMQSLVTCILLVSISAIVATEAASVNIFEQYNFTGGTFMSRGLHDVLTQRSYGMANYEYNVPMSERAVFPIGSNTKLLTAISMYQLQERGLVNIKDSVAQYLGPADFAAFGFPNMTKYCPQLANSTKCEVITFEQLMSMSAGIKEDIMTIMMPYAGSIGAVFGMYLSAPLLFTPGTQYYYSNPSFILCGYIVEKLSGMSLEQYYKKYIFDVVGMKNTYYDPYDGKFNLNSYRVTEYYEYYDQDTKTLLGRGRCQPEMPVGSANAAGGAMSTMYDEALLYFTLFNFSEGITTPNPLLSVESRRSLIKPRIRAKVPIPGVEKLTYFAQGLFVAVHARDVKAPIPRFIMYGGALVCVHTVNLLDLTVPSMPLMSQAFGSVNVYYVNKSTYETARRMRSGNFWEVTGSWKAPPILGEMVWIWHNQVAPGP